MGVKNARPVLWLPGGKQEEDPLSMLLLLLPNVLPTECGPPHCTAQGRLLTTAVVLMMILIQSIAPPQGEC
jgi:hypothetical protein